MLEKTFNQFEKINDLIESINESFSCETSKNLVIYGSYGLGKHYILNEFCNLFHTKFSIYNFIGDKLQPYNKKMSKYVVDFSFSLEYFAGISLSINQNKMSLIESIISSFKKIKKQNILLIVPDYQNLSIENKKILEMIINYKNVIEENTKSKLNILISFSTLNNELLDFETFEKIHFLPYDSSNIAFYLCKTKKIKSEMIKDFELKIDKIKVLSNSNLDLIDLIYEDILFNDYNSKLTLNNLISKRIELIKVSAQTKGIDPKIIEDIIFTCSLCYKTFNESQIDSITHYDNKTIIDIINMSLVESLIKEIDLKKYIFSSEDIKKDIEQFYFASYHPRFIDYYNYITMNNIDNYFFRGYYLFKGTQKIDLNSFSLLLLALSDAQIIEDQEIVNEVIGICSFDKKVLDFTNEFIAALNFQKTGEYLKSSKILNKLVNMLPSSATVLYFEIKRLLFKNNISSKNFSDDQNLIYEELIACVREKHLYLNISTPYMRIEELSLKLKIIFEIEPYVLDNMGNYDLFQELFQTCNAIIELLQRQSILNKSSQYIKYTFYRKAFLFANPNSCNFYYNEAKKYFQEHNFKLQYIMTLISQAGTNIANQEFDYSIDLLRQAQKELQVSQIILPQPEKLENNRIISVFLKKELEYGDSINTIFEYAKKSINQLKKLLLTAEHSTKNVILTNLASLSLYIHNIPLYLEVKAEIEKSLNCQDVSDVFNFNVNDFYRYHFAWDEIYRGMLENQWDECAKKADDLTDFVPALFKKQELVWTLKIEAIKKLIKEKKILNGYEFCNKLVKYSFVPNKPVLFFSRGLMLSDLQYTSYS